MKVREDLTDVIMCCVRPIENESWLRSMTKRKTGRVDLGVGARMMGLRALVEGSAPEFNTNVASSSTERTIPASTVWGAGRL
jgi:hypothetical protein